MSDGAPTSYADLAQVIENLPLLVRENRRRRGLSLRASADEIGCGFTTLMRIEDGAGFNSRITVDLLRWLDRR